MKLRRRIYNLFHPRERRAFEEHNRYVATMPQDIREAHSHCAQHRDEILSSKLCGCFYCLKTFQPSAIKEWIVNGTCAMCPKCGIDAVLGDKSGYPMTHDFLAEMHEYWFEHSQRI